MLYVKNKTHKNNYFLRGWLIVTVVAIIVLIVFSCKNVKKNDIIVVSDSITTIEMKHYNGGEVEEKELSNYEITELKNWLNNIRIKKENFSESKAPSEQNGVDAYVFELAGDENSEFVYYYCGESTSYLMKGDKWYKILGEQTFPF